MDPVAVVVVTATIVVWGAVSARLARADLTAPVVFVALGALLGVVDVVHRPTAPTDLKPLVEVALVWVLFSDAARVRVRDARGDVRAYLRLLGIGLPLTVALGWLLAHLLFPQLDVWVALLVGAALAPTDAALGVPVVTNPAVPGRIRRLITVESGLNDGIVTPVVLVAIAGAAVAEHVSDTPVWDAVLELAIGALVGVVVGWLGGTMLRRAHDAGWAAEEFVGVAVLALALLGYVAAGQAHGNGFVAAFLAGLAYGRAAGPQGRSELEFLEQASGLVSLLVWLVFGAVAVPAVVEQLDLATLVYAVLSLTVIRMVPVALSCLGSGFDRATVVFVGWFGPRGLASLVFALLALEELGSGAGPAVSVIAATVVLSVLAHGFTSGPLASRYGAAERARGVEPDVPGAHLPVRGLPRRADPVPGGPDAS